MCRRQRVCPCVELAVGFLRVSTSRDSRCCDTLELPFWFTVHLFSSLPTKITKKQEPLQLDPVKKSGQSLRALQNLGTTSTHTPTCIQSVSQPVRQSSIRLCKPSFMHTYRYTCMHTYIHTYVQHHATQYGKLLLTARCNHNSIQCMHVRISHVRREGSLPLWESHKLNCGVLAYPFMLLEVRIHARCKVC